MTLSEVSSAVPSYFYLDPLERKKTRLFLGEKSPQSSDKFGRSISKTTIYDILKDPQAWAI